MHLIRDITSFVFGIALFINAILFIPQIVKLLKTKSSKGVSKITFVGFCFIQIAAIAYGIIYNDMVLVVGYVLSLVTCGFATILIYKYSS